MQAQAEPYLPDELLDIDTGSLNICFEAFIHFGNIDIV